MKMRIRGNSLRLRLTRSEVTNLVDSGCVEESIGFAPDATSFTLRATKDSDEYGITQNTYLMEHARCVDYVVTISVDGDELTYDETTTLLMDEFDEPYAHTDRNTLQRVETFELPPYA